MLFFLDRWRATVAELLRPALGRRRCHLAKRRGERQQWVHAKACATELWIGAAIGLGSMTAGCSQNEVCGPAFGLVSRVIDGDTAELWGGETLRYLMVDAPETTGGQVGCYGAEAREFNRRCVSGRELELVYDRQCTDRYGRLLAYVFVDGAEVNRTLVEHGYARVLHLPPNGGQRLEEYEALEARARSLRNGLWGACRSNQ